MDEYEIEEHDGVDTLIEEAGPCPQCGDPDVRFAGWLGRKLWLRCRSCGAERHIEPAAGS
jgi:translation initiation factor 2 beta subunit (eIF-2beta)/eIF-5